jgi:tripartite-type tricarboxylate transporter receptor subunit TctC
MMMRKSTNWLRAIGVATSLSILAPVASFAQQDFPNRPVRLIVGFSAGGPTDVFARLVAQDMTATLGQPVIVENRPGANSLIGTEAVARSAPDGYTLTVSTLAHNVNPILIPDRAKYQPIDDFAPISLAILLPLVVVTGYDSPYKSVQEIVAAAKAPNAQVTYGSAGHGGSAHLAAALLANQAKADMTHVPFKGNAPALTEVIAGRVSFMFYPMVGIPEQVAAKRLRVLAVTTAERHPDYPSVPTMAESGFPGFENYTQGLGFLAPAGTPPAVVKKLNEAINASLARPETQERLRGIGAIKVGSTPQEFTRWLKEDHQRWERLIKAAGVKAE